MSSIRDFEDFLFLKLPEILTEYNNISGQADLWLDLTNLKVTLVNKSDNKLSLRDKAFAITAAFEGSSYSAINTYDSGIVSYGRFQFTLASGNLYKLLKLYYKLNPSDSILGVLLSNIETKDVSLKNNQTFLTHLVELGKTDLMRTCQNNLAQEVFYDPAVKLSVVPRNLQLPLSVAFVFDTSIQHGVFHSIFTTAEQQLKMPVKQAVKSVEEEKLLMKKAAKIRSDILYRLADTRNLPGLKPRADFWVNAMNNEFWNLSMDRIEVKKGLFVDL